MRRPLTGAVARLQSHPIALGLLVLAIGAFLAYVSAIAVNGVPFQDRYQASMFIPGDPPPMKVSDEVRVGGQRAGVITGVEPRPDGVLVRFELKPDYAPLTEDTAVHVRVKLTTSLVYINLDRGTGPALAEGGTIPGDQVVFSSTLPQVVEAFDEQTRIAFGRTLEVAGAGLNHRGSETNVALQDLKSVLTDGLPLLDAASPEPGALSGMIEGTRRTLRGLAGGRPDDLAATLPEARSTLESLASRSRELGDAVDQVRPAEDQVLTTFPLADPVLDDASRLARDLEPGARALRATLPDVNDLLDASGRFRAQTERFSNAADPALRVAAPALAALLEPVRTVEPIGRALAPVIERLGRYEDEIAAAGHGLAAVTSKPFADGVAAGNPAMRFSGILTCHKDRDPYPKPGEADKQRGNRAC